MLEVRPLSLCLGGPPPEAKASPSSTSTTPHPRISTLLYYEDFGTPRLSDMMTTLLRRRTRPGRVQRSDGEGQEDRIETENRRYIHTSWNQMTRGNWKLQKVRLSVLTGIQTKNNRGNGVCDLFCKWTLTESLSETRLTHTGFGLVPVLVFTGNNVSYDTTSTVVPSLCLRKDF